MFKFVVLISVILVVSCLGAAPRYRRPRLDGRIVGGSDVDISEVPYQLSLEYNGLHMCGASIVAENFAITAAHCVDGVPASMIRFRAGSSTRESGGSLHPAADIFVHPEFSFYTIDYDMALVAVDVPFTYSMNVLPVLIGVYEPAAGSMATVSGWGTTSSGGNLPEQLQKVTVPIVSRDVCNATYADYGGITKRMICAGVQEGGKDSCQGDSGGPLVINEHLVGIVSWGLGCGVPGYPGVYTNVAELFQFFRNKMNIPVQINQH